MEPIFEVISEKMEKNYAELAITPLVAGFGDTLGVSLRRVLLTALPGGAITSVKISGVRHQFTTVKGMKEDVLEFILNLKKVRLVIEGEGPEKLSLSAKGPGEVKAGDIKVSGGASIANPELLLASLAEGAKLEAEMEAERGVGYVPAEERTIDKIGVIPLDASFSPVLRVNYKVEETRVGRFTNYDKLILEITTDGTITPREALSKAASILSSYFNQIIFPKKVAKKEAVKSDAGLGMVAKLSVEEIGIPTRVANALIKSGFDTVEKLIGASHEDLMKVRNLGEKSLKIVKAALMEKGVELTNA